MNITIVKLRLDKMSHIKSTRTHIHTEFNPQARTAGAEQLPLRWLTEDWRK